VSPKHHYLVTGAAGFIGSHLSEALIRRGDAVTGVDNFDPFYARAVKERNLTALRKLQDFRFVEADVARDPLPLDGIEAIIHLGAKPGVRPSLEDPGSYMEANVTATARLIDAARRVVLNETFEIARQHIDLNINSRPARVLTDHRHGLRVRDDVDLELRGADGIDREAHAVDGDRSFRRNVT